MMREVVKLVNEAVNEGHERGVSLFMENLEEDLVKERIFEEHGLDPVMTQLFEEAGVDVENIEDMENIDESKVDKMLEDLESNLGAE